MRTIIKTFFLLLLSAITLAQPRVADSLKKLLQSHSQNDTVRINLLNNLAKESRRSNPKLTDSLITVALNLSNQLNYKKGKGNALAIKAVRYYDVSDYPSATKTFDEAKQLLQSANDISGEIYFYKMRATLLMDEGSYALSLDDFLKGLKLAQESGDVKQVIDIKGTIGYLYNVIGDYEKAIPYQTEALKQAESINYKVGISRAYNAIGKTNKTRGNYPASLEAYTKGLHVDEQLKDTATIYVDYGNIGDVHERMGQYKEAFSFIIPAWNFDRLRPGNTKTAWDEWIIGKAFTHSGNADSGLYYAKHSLQLAHQMGWRLYLREITFLIAESAAKLNKWDTAYKYLALSSAYKDTLTGQDIARKTTMLQAGFELDKKQAEIELQKAENRKNRAFLLMVLGGLASVIVLAVILFRNNRHKQKANELLKKQKQQIDEQRAKAEEALQALRTTQAQLLQSEKMASLGELTAGIAHEIQNPLNFVNNFSEVSTELADELKDAVEKNDNKQAIAIADDIKQNLNKINHHGKRADAIVKGMLQHSRSSSGKKEPTDINVLADEYLRLSYHGLRAKDKTFNATMETHYDDSLEKINIIPQDVGRVILNLFTNAFYSVSEKKTLRQAQDDNLPTGQAGYKPTVSVTTKKIKDGVQIIVRDNGNGIPRKVLDKIYQPFFTTKPTGEGTGLGLSLSYDIIKAHNGELKVETKEGEFAEFIINLPTV